MHDAIQLLVAIFVFIRVDIENVARSKGELDLKYLLSCLFQPLVYLPYFVILKVKSVSWKQLLVWVVNVFDGEIPFIGPDIKLCLVNFVSRMWTQNSNV